MTGIDLPRWLEGTKAPDDEDPRVQYLRYELCAMAVDAWWASAWAMSLVEAEHVTQEALPAYAGDLPRSTYMAVLRSFDETELRRLVDGAPADALARMKKRSAELEHAYTNEGGS